MATVLGKFDVLEMNDEKSGYLRTAWVGKIKFISEASDSPRTPHTADEQFDPIGRILKTYDGFLDELITKLKT